MLQIRTTVFGWCACATVLIACGGSGSTGTGGGGGDTSTSAKTSTGSMATGSTTTGSMSTGSTSTSTGGPVCGDGTVNGSEQCDGASLAGQTCVTQGFDAGTLACKANCTFDIAGCVTFTCGDGMINGNEQCDGAMLGGATCITQGFTGGTLACTANTCVFDTSGCGTENCTDGVDNDFDTMVDCSDTDCMAACADACDTPPTLTDPANVSGDTTGHADVYQGSCENPGGGEVVYTFTPSQTGMVDITLSSASDQGISVWTDCGTGEQGCSDDFLGGTDEHLSVPVTSGTPISIQVEAYGTGDEGPFTLAVASRPIVCGDGIVDPGEACDDGNTMPNDGCSATCTVECGDGVCGPNEDSCSCAADCADDPNSCSTCECGDTGGNCYCDSLCASFGDCCANKVATCGAQNSAISFSSNAAPIGPVDNSYDGTLASMACVTVPTSAVGTVVSVDSVELTAAHTFIGDLTFKLVSPMGTVVTLMSRPGLTETADSNAGGCCGSPDDLVTTAPITFQTGALVSAEDMGLAAGTIVCQAAAPGDNVCFYAPNPGIALPGDLTTFVGQPATGNWQFCMGDAAPADTGTINGVTINMTISG